MPKLILEQDDGTREEFTTFFAVLATDAGDGAEIRQVIGLDCRVLVAGAMLKKAIIKASDAWDEFVKRTFSDRELISMEPDNEAFRKRIKWSMN